MGAYLTEMFGVSLAMTICIELAVAYLTLWRPEKGRKRGKAGWILVVILVNVLTNPPAVLFCWLGRMYLPFVPPLLLQGMTEGVVVAVEACVYCCFAGSPGWGIRRPVFLSVAANACSWICGLLFMFRVIKV